MLEIEQFEFPPARPVRRNTGFKLFEFLVINNVDKTEHAERAYAYDEEEAHSLLRLTWAIGVYDLKCVPVWNIFVTCKQCHRKRILASGYNIHSISTAQKLEIVRRMGWTYETGVYLCRQCSSPLTQDEMDEERRLKSVLNHRNDNGREEYDQFVSDLQIVHEQWRVKRYTDSVDEFEQGKGFAQS
jgi:hypothetical protein